MKTIVIVAIIIVAALAITAALFLWCFPEYLIASDMTQEEKNLDVISICFFLVALALAYGVKIWIGLN